jgi:hypothetical protein
VAVVRENEEEKMKGGGGKLRRRGTPIRSKWPLLVGAWTSQTQGCQMVCFQTKNPSLGKFLKALDWTMFRYFMALWNILHTFGIFYDHSVYFVFIWYIFSGLGILCQLKSGNPGQTMDEQNLAKCGSISLTDTFSSQVCLGLNRTTNFYLQPTL